MAAGDNLFNNAISTITAGAGPSWTPTGTQSVWAREEDTSSIWYWTGAAWVNIDLDFVRTYTGTILTDNDSSLGDQLQALETAIAGIVQDGNHTYVSRAGSTQNVAPTSGEVSSPENGDTADIYLQTAEILEKWAYTSSWSKVISIDLSATVSNLGYTASATNGIVTNSAGTNSTVPAATASLAGLILPAEKTQIATNTTDISNLETLSGVSGAVNNGTFTGATIPNSSTTKAALQALETALEAIDPSIDNIADTNSVNLTVDGSDQLTADVKRSATQDNYITITESADGLRITTSSLTAYGTHALAAAAVSVGDKYLLTSANLEGVPSDGTSGPVFERVS
tara:strand:+ start:190 stop:1212 length:1023 start_codon:yes stop_codon:yes gene_type:complete